MFAGGLILKSLSPGWSWIPTVSDLGLCDGVTCQMAFKFVRRFNQGARLWQTDRQMRSNRQNRYFAPKINVRTLSILRYFLWPLSMTFWPGNLLGRGQFPHVGKSFCCRPKFSPKTAKFGAKIFIFGKLSSKVKILITLSENCSCVGILSEICSACRKIATSCPVWLWPTTPLSTFLQILLLNAGAVIIFSNTLFSYCKIFTLVLSSVH